MADKLKKLTVKEAAFVEEFLVSGSNSVAYKAAYDVDNMQDNTIHSRAYEVANRPHVKSEVKVRRAELAERCKVEQVDLLQQYFKIIDDYNEGIHLSKTGDAQDKKKAYVISKFVNSSSAVAALKAIAEMTGLSAPTPTAINQGVIINIIQPKE